MIYNTPEYWVSGICPLSGILNTGKHNVSETGSVSFIRCEGGDTYSVGHLERASLYHRTTHAT
jgi:hypothetical protein